jgi:selenocysteine lyase/cysteine desulfurase
MRDVAGLKLSTKPTDIEALRADTPGLAHRVHLNNAGASMMPNPVIDAIKGHIDLEARVGGYEAAAEAAEAIEASYEHLATLLGTSPDRVAMTEHATASFAAALSAIPFERGDLIVTTRNDYVSNQIQYLSLAHRLGVEVVRAEDAPEGGVDLHAMEELIHRRRPKLVALTQIPTNSGLVQDADAVGVMCRARGVLYLVDGCQSVGQMPVDVERMGCDFFSGTSRKYLRGPRGAGFLYVSDRVLEGGFEPLFPDMRGADWIDTDLYQPSPDARRFETWEFAYGLVLGTGAAAAYTNKLGIKAIRDRSWGLASKLRERLEEMPGCTVLDRGAVLSATVTASFEGHVPSDLVSALRTRGINTSSQTRIDAVIDYDDKGVDGALRMSPHYFNTEADLDALMGALHEIVGS